MPWPGALLARIPVTARLGIKAEPLPMHADPFRTVLCCSSACRFSFAAGSRLRLAPTIGPRSHRRDSLSASAPGFSTAGAQPHASPANHGAGPSASAHARASRQPTPWRWSTSSWRQESPATSRRTVPSLYDLRQAPVIGLLRPRPLRWYRVGARSPLYAPHLRQRRITHYLRTTLAIRCRPPGAPLRQLAEAAAEGTTAEHYRGGWGSRERWREIQMACSITVIALQR